MRLELVSPTVAVLVLALAAVVPACDLPKPPPAAVDAGFDPLPCENESPVTAAGLAARRKACKSLCDQGSRSHCVVLARVCQTSTPGGQLCPAESVAALARACELGSAGSCLSAGKSLERGEHGVAADAKQAAALTARACQLDPTICFKVDPAQAAAALKALTAVKIPGGTFTPGKRPYAPASQPAAARPAKVTVAPFDIDRTEVTVGAYAACVSAGKCSEPQAGGDCNWSRPDRLDHPMNCVSAGEAAAFCAFRGRRLPSEDEWELAARGTDGRSFPWGKAAPGAQLCWKRTGTCPAGSHPAGKSPFGVLDLEGNVTEWTTSHVLVTEKNVPGPATVARGSSYADTTPARLGLANQHYHKSFETLPTVGFRCAGPNRPTAPVPPAADAGGR